MARPPRRRRTILAFGESPNDTHALKELVAGLRPDLPAVVPRREPIILPARSGAPKKTTLATRIAQVVRAEQVLGEVIAVLAHRDLDAIEPRASADEMHPNETELRDAVSAMMPPGPMVVPVVPAWEMEAWWFLWPDQIAALRPGWRKLPDRTGQRVDRIAKAKEKLTADLRPPGRARMPDFSESDGPRIAALVRQAGAARTPKGRSVAYDRLVSAIDALKP